jgi:hypothetical protein
MDLAIFTSDRDERNEVSYRPSRMVDSKLAGPASVAPPVSSIWRSLEPSGGSSYGPLDAELLRASLVSGYESAKQANPQLRRFRDYVTGIVGAAPITALAKELWIDALTSTTITAPKTVLRRAGELASATSLGGHIPVMCRALLLLRVASGMTANALRAANVTLSSLGFWVDDIGTRHGIWDPGSAPPDILDLWSDVEVAIEEMDQTARTSPADLSSWRASNSYSMITASETERAHLWGIAAI